MKSINVKFLPVAILIAACTLASCKKDKDDNSPQSKLEGTWEGLYGSGNDAPTVFFSFIINKNGTLQVKAEDKNDPFPGTGTWTLKDNEFKAVYQYDGFSDKFNVAAKYDEVQKKLTGSWGTGESEADAGDFYMNKK